MFVISKSPNQTEKRGKSGKKQTAKKIAEDFGSTPTEGHESESPVERPQTTKGKRIKATLPKGNKALFSTFCFTFLEKEFVLLTK